MQNTNLKNRIIPLAAAFLLILASNAPAGVPKPLTHPKRPKALTSLYRQEHPQHHSLHFAWPVQYK